MNRYPDNNLKVSQIKNKEPRIADSTLFKTFSEKNVESMFKDQIATALTPFKIRKRDYGSIFQNPTTATQTAIGKSSIPKNLGI